MVVNPLIPYVHSVKSLTSLYDAFIIDLWGVIHDGRSIYPGVKDALILLREQNKKIIFLSNAPRRAKKAKLVLDNLGIDESLYDLLLTSGESVFHWSESLPFPGGTKYKIIGPAKDDDLLSEHPSYIQVDKVEDSQLAVITGYDDDNSDADEKTPQLKEALQRDIYMVCANPDHVVVRLDGSSALCAGIIAEKYEALGGKVHYFGKPYKSVYDRCFDYLKDTFKITDTKRIAAIGDNLDTDIKGGINAGIDTYLIVGGILAREFNIVHGELPDQEAFSLYCYDRTIIPHAAMPGLLS